MNGSDEASSTGLAEAGNHSFVRISEMQCRLARICALNIVIDLWIPAATSRW